MKIKAADCACITTNESKPYRMEKLWNSDFGKRKHIKMVEFNIGQDPKSIMS